MLEFSYLLNKLDSSQPFDLFGIFVNLGDPTLDVRNWESEIQGK